MALENEQAALKPCPFCGGPAQISSAGFGYHTVHCEACHIVQPGKPREAAISAWNTRALEASQAGAVDNAEKMRRIDDFMVEEIFADQSEQPWRADDFKGDNAHLIDCIDAFLDLNDDHAMAPTNLSKGHHAYRLLCAARHRLATPPIQAAEIKDDEHTPVIGSNKIRRTFKKPNNQSSQAAESGLLDEAAEIAIHETEIVALSLEGKGDDNLAAAFRKIGAKIARGIRAKAGKPGEGVIVDADKALVEALELLEWYGEQARLARLVHSEGDAGRHALADDGGKRASALLAKAGKPQSEG